MVSYDVSVSDTRFILMRTLTNVCVDCCAAVNVCIAAFCPFHIGNFAVAGMQAHDLVSDDLLLLAGLPQCGASYSNGARCLSICLSVYVSHVNISKTARWSYLNYKTQLGNLPSRFSICHQLHGQKYGSQYWMFLGRHLTHCDRNRKWAFSMGVVASLCVI